MKSLSTVVIPVTVKSACIVDPAPAAKNPSVNSTLWKKLEIPRTRRSPCSLVLPSTVRISVGLVRPIPM